MPIENFVYRSNPTRCIEYVSHTVHVAQLPRGIDYVIYHEYDDHGSHRLRTIHATGHWARYGEPAVITVPEINKTYVGYTEFIGEVVHEVRLLRVRG